ncbi:MAG: type II secretion system protein GspK [Candidatus Omnitrophica bacterium]|jgi:general secretion pathway protein K|nr:general secretion pathway protein GspK [Candidatus Omnitrophota bacterium]MDD5078754.1 type II secretion system protein GspK [Candidatus Omnitrophota bacterium]
MSRGILGPGRRPRQGNKGLILIVALWSLCILSAFAVIIGYQVRQKLVLIKRLEERGKLHLIAQAGMIKAAVELRKEDEKDYDALNDPWCDNPGAFRNVAMSDGVFDIYYDYTDSGSGEVRRRYGMVDEESRVNINAVDFKVLKRLFYLALNADESDAEGLAASVMDWRDADSSLILSDRSAEDSFYRSGIYPYESKDAGLQVLEELLLVRGFNENIFEKIKAYITIYSSGKVNINTAPKTVLMALGIDANVAENIMFFRAGKDGINLTADDNYFESIGNIVPELSRNYSMTVNQIAALSSVVTQSITVRSSVFRGKSRARLNSRRDTNEIDFVIDRSGRVLYCREG